MAKIVLLDDRSEFEIREASPIELTTHPVIEIKSIETQQSVIVIDSGTLIHESK